MGTPEERSDLQIRRATVAEAPALAELWCRARRAAVDVIPAPVHSDDEVRSWFAHHLLPTHEVWTALDSDSHIGLMALHEQWVEQLYIHPSWWGRGVGTRLLQLAQGHRDRLTLWTFQSNHGACRFYERHGFVAVAQTDGENEEAAPDVMYLWEAD